MNLYEANFPTIGHNVVEKWKKCYSRGKATSNSIRRNRVSSELLMGINGCNSVVIHVKEIMKLVRNSLAPSFSVCDRLISLDVGIGSGPFLRLPHASENFDGGFCHMWFAANRLVSHLESCNRANWSTIRARFQFRLLSPEYHGL